MTDATSIPVPGNSARKRSRLWQLEALRGVAALHVMLNHIFNSYLNVKHTWWNFPFRFGQEGVLVFFLLSGFVICYAHGAPGADVGGFKSYLFKRGRRIYPIFILSLVLAYVVQCTLSAGSRFLGPSDFKTLVGNLVMLQDNPGKPGTFVYPFGDNAPLWSLSYEWWFYMMFYPINRWVACEKQKFLVLGLCGCGLLANQFVPNSVFNFLVLFLIWWAGVEMAREFTAAGRVTFRRQAVMLGLRVGPMLWYGVLVGQRLAAGQHISVIEFPFMGLRYFFMAAVYILIGFIWQHWRFAGYRQTIGQFEWVGSISYALYLFHYPVVRDLRLFSGTTTFIFYGDLGLRILIAFALAWLAERHLQKWINTATNPWLSRPQKSQAAEAPAAGK